MNIVVLTSICGGRDRLIQDQFIGQARWIAFIDYPAASRIWEIRSACADFSSPRRNSRAPKIATHRFVDCEYSIWIDANTRLLRRPEELVEAYLAKHDIAVFRHPVRDCLYEEVQACAENGLGDPVLLQQQADAYRRSGFPPRSGMSENMCVMRRHTRTVEHFNEAWWGEYCRYSDRDQVSFPIAAAASGVTVNYIPVGEDEVIGDRSIRCGFLEMRPHFPPTFE